MTEDVCRVCKRLPATHTHHRKLRSQGGSDDPINLIRVCAFCHDRIHANPEDSYRQGLLIRSWQTEEDVPIRMLGEAAFSSGPPDREAGAVSPSIPGDGIGDARPICPKCKGTGHIPEESKEPGLDKTSRHKVTWAIRVPKDERENGHEILETLAKECSILLGWEGKRGASYYTLARVLAWFLQTYSPETDG